MKYLFTGLYPLWNYHYVTELNLMQKHIDSGDEVWITQCSAELKNCECNFNHELAHCLRCIGMADDGLSYIEGKFNKIPLIQPYYWKKYPKEYPIQFKSLEHLKKCTLEGYDIGMAVYSCLIDRTRSSSPDINLNQKTIDELYLDAWRAWESAKKTLSEMRFDKVYIFNGRYTVARAWIKACKINNIPFSTHERLSSLKCSYVFDNNVIHDNDQYGELIEKFWNQSKDDPKVYAEGVEFFEERPSGKITGWVSHSKSQSSCSMPESWDPNRRNISIFASSENELLGVAENYRGGVYKDQISAYSDIISKVKKIENRIKFYIRVHPASLGEKVKWWEDASFREMDNLEIISPDSRVSSYALMFASEKSIAYQSTMGVEATYWGKPSLILEKTFYYQNDCGFYPKNHQDIYDWIIGFPQPSPKINAIKFGAFMRCAGERLIHSTPVNFYTLQFKGKTLEARREVHEWLGECEKRPAVTGIKKWLRVRNDKQRFRRIIKECGGDLAASSQAI